MHIFLHVIAAVTGRAAPTKKKVRWMEKEVEEGVCGAKDGMRVRCGKASRFNRFCEEHAYLNYFSHALYKSLPYNMWHVEFACRLVHGLFLYNSIDFGHAEYLARMISQKIYFQDIIKYASYKSKQKGRLENYLNGHAGQADIHFHIRDMIMNNTYNTDTKFIFHSQNSCCNYGHIKYYKLFQVCVETLEQNCSVGFDLKHVIKYLLDNEIIKPRVYLSLWQPLQVRKNKEKEDVKEDVKEEEEENWETESDEEREEIWVKQTGELEEEELWD